MRRLTHFILSRISLALSSLLFISSICNAERISISSDQKLSLSEESLTELKLAGTILLENRGDEDAIDVLPAIICENARWSGEGVTLSPGSSNLWNVNIKIPKGTSAQNPTEGALPVIITRYYKDRNRYEFSTKDIQILLTPNSLPRREELIATQQLKSKIQLISEGDEFFGKVIVENSSGKPFRFMPTILSSDELKFVELSPQTIEPYKKIEIPVSGSNFRALSGSVYAVFSMIQWTDSNYRRVAVSGTAINVFASTQRKVMKQITIVVVFLWFALIALLIRSAFKAN